MKSFRKRASGFMFAAVMTVSLTSVLPLNVADAKATQTERITFAKGTSKTRIVRTARTTTMQFKLRFRAGQHLNLWVSAPSLRGTAQSAAFFDDTGASLPIYDEYAYVDEGVGHWVVLAASTGDIHIRLTDLGLGARYQLTFEALNKAPKRG